MINSANGYTIFNLRAPGVIDLETVDPGLSVECNALWQAGRTELAGLGRGAVHNEQGN